MNCEFQEQGALESLFIGFSRSGSDKKLALKFLKAARQSEVLKANNYEYYSDTGNGWLYGKFPDGENKELSFPVKDADAILSGFLDEKVRVCFVDKMVGYLAGMLKDAICIVDHLED